ncbi:hypothetical protein INT45_008197 [Circinella minor]|uniref:Trimethylguanosine synthase n=1 Tax=Circinella minor TaxID=1195481 RepID=A0A8H7S0X8_9FUNG|nr:hypothetical protein INT45_008197 [Circinella minor]
MDTEIYNSNNSTTRKECIAEKTNESLNINASTESSTIMIKESEITQIEKDKVLEEDILEEVSIVSKSTSILSNEETITTNNDEQPLGITTTIGEQATEILGKDKGHTVLLVDDESGQAKDDLITLSSSSSLQTVVAEAPNDNEKEKDLSITTTKKKREYDVYSGYDQSSSKKKNKRSRKKRKSDNNNNNDDNDIILERSEIYNDVIVRYAPKDLPESLIKYYNQRYSYFSKYDQGILMDQEGWFSVTPEKIARHIAERCRSNIIIDAFTGCGGNAIQFALTCERVIAIDIDPVKLHCARHNAKVYGVEDRIEFIQGDFFKLAPTLKADVIFLSPPWGGPSYQQSTIFDITTMIPGNGVTIYSMASNITPRVAYFVPRNTNPQQLAHLAGPKGVCEIEQNYLRGNLKALTVYYGDLVNKDYVSQAKALDNESSS